jgi:hypothetical protein
MKFRLKDEAQHEEIIDVEEVKPETEEKPAEEPKAEEKPADKASSKGSDLSADDISQLKEFIAEYLPLIKQMFGDVSEPADDKEKEDDKKEEKPAEEPKAEEAKGSAPVEEPKKSNDELTEDSCDSGKTFGDSVSTGAVKTSTKVIDSISKHEDDVAAAWQAHYNKYFNQGE